MTRRDYRIVAAKLADQMTTDNDLETVAAIARSLADVFKGQNPSFRYDYFFDAVGLDKWGHVK
jgi:hypothetical protein